MPLLIVKSLSGVNFAVKNKTIALNGNGVINEVADSDFTELKKNTAFCDMSDKGFIIESASHKAKDEVKSDIMAEVADKQEADMEKAGRKTKRT